MSNEIYKEKNKEDFSEETKERINKFLEFVSINLPEDDDYLFVADICCGNGYISEELQHFLERYDSCNDPRYFRSLYDYYPVNENVNFIDLNKPYISEHKFNLVFFIHALEHFKKPQMVLQSLRSFLSDDGLLFIVVPNCEYNEKARNPNLGHEQFFDFDSLKGLLKNDLSEEFEIKFIAENNQDRGFEEIWAICSKKWIQI